MHTLAFAFVLSVSSSSASTRFIDVHVDRRDNEPIAQTEGRLRDALLHALADVEIAPRCRARTVVADASVMQRVLAKMTLEPNVMPPTAELALDDELESALQAACDASVEARVAHRMRTHKAAPDVVDCDVEHDEVSAIELEFSERFMAPVERVVLHADGTVDVGGRDAGKRGKLARKRFDAVVRALDDAGFFCMLDGYRDANANDAAFSITATTTTWKKSVDVVGSGAPPKLRHARALIVELLHDVLWDAEKR